MKHVLIIGGLLILQCYLIVCGGHDFGKYLNPVLLFVVSGIIPVYYLYVSLKNPEAPAVSVFSFGWLQWIGILFGMLIMMFSYEEVRKAFVEYSDPEKFSDVVPQARILFERFRNGEETYAPIPFSSYTLQPIYMPLHWLPIYLSLPFHVDIRWVGWGLIVLASGLYGYLLSTTGKLPWKAFFVLALPSIPLWAFIMLQRHELSISFDMVIGAYYLLLGIGLMTRQLWLVVLGITVCLLSRYTLLFWLPLFALVLWLDQGWKKSVTVWSIVIVSFIVVFIIPFYNEDPTLLQRGFSHHLNATVADWVGSGEPPISWTQEAGINIAPIMKRVLSGEMAVRVYQTRQIQTAALLLSLSFCVWGYFRWKAKIDYYAYSLFCLYIMLFVFYFFAPLTYRYYLFSFLMISAVVCGKTILNGSGKIRHT